ncbi:hypothetical protein QU38_00665, partial [Staphylococcus aureus]
ALSARVGELGLVRASGREARTAADLLDPHRNAADRHRDDCLALAGAGGGRHRRRHHRLFRRPLDRVQLGRKASAGEPGAGGGLLPVLLLSRVERARIGGRNRLDRLGLERGGALLRGADAGGAGDRREAGDGAA